MSSTISTALSNYSDYYERILKTGSRVICSPPPEDTDEDYLVLCTQAQRVELESRLQQDGWQLGGSLPNTGALVGDWELNTEHQYVGGVIDHSRVFHSWKRRETPAVYEPIEGQWILNIVSKAKGPEINLLVTCNEQYFDDFTRATFLCQGLNLLDKADRVTVFEALTRDVWPTGPKNKNKYIFRGLAEHYEYEQATAIPPSVWNTLTDTTGAAIPVGQTGVDITW